MATLTPPVTPGVTPPAPGAYNQNGGRGAGTFTQNGGNFVPAGSKLAGATDANGNFDAAKAQQLGTTPQPFQLYPNTDHPITPGAPSSPQIVSSSQNAVDDLNNIKSISSQVGQSIQTQAQTNQANANANAQAQAQQAQQAQNAPQTPVKPEDEPITAGDLQDALNSTQGNTQTPQNGQVTTDANGIQSVQAPNNNGASDLNQNINDIKDSYSPEIGQLNDQQSQLNQQIADISSLQIKGATEVQQQLQGLMNGTIPLSTGDQAQLSGLNAQYAQLIAQAQGSAQAYTAGVTAAGMASGRAMYTPELNLSLVNQATNDGIQQVQTLTAEGAAAYAKLDSALVANDIDEIQASYKTMNDALTARSNAVQSMITQTQAAITQAYSQQHDDIQTALQSTQISDTEKQNVFEDAMSNAKFTEQQKQDTVDNYYKGVEASQNQEKINLQQAQLSATDDTNALLAANNQKTTPSGTVYVSSAGLSPEAQAAAIKQGHIVLNDANDKTIDTITGGQTAFTALMTSFMNSGVADSNGQLVTGGLNTIRTFGNQLSKSGTKEDFNTFTTSINKTISDLQSQGNSLTGQYISQIEDNVPKSGDSVSTAASKISRLNDALTNASNSILATSLNSSSYTAPDGTVYTAGGDGKYYPLQ